MQKENKKLRNEQNKNSFSLIRIKNRSRARSRGEKVDEEETKATQISHIQNYIGQTNEKLQYLMQKELKQDSKLEKILVKTYDL